MSKPPFKSGGSKSGGNKSGGAAGGSGRGRPPSGSSRGGPRGSSSAPGNAPRDGSAREGAARDGSPRGPRWADGPRADGPRRAERDDKRRGETPRSGYGAKADGERGGRAGARDRSRDDRPRGERPRGANSRDKSGDENRRGDTPRGAYGAKSEGARGARSVGRDRFRDERPRSDGPRGDRVYGDRPRSETPRAASPSAGRSDTGRRDAPRGGYGAKADGERPARFGGNDRGRDERPRFGTDRRDERPRGDRARGDYPRGERSGFGASAPQRGPAPGKRPGPAPRAAAPTPKDPSLPARDGERIAKLLARAGIASRREAERLIEAGRVMLGETVIDTPATVLPNLRGVTVDGNPVKDAEATRLFLFHKPAGLITAERDPAGRPTIYAALRNALPEGAGRVMPIGRLDLSTEGLLLLTNDGEFKRQLELPATGVPRTYRARTFGDISQGQLEELMEGIEVDGVIYGRIDANMERRTGRNQWIEMTLTEGKNREVRRVLEALGLQVSRLLRTAYGPFRLGDMPKGTTGEVSQRDLENFRRTLPKAGHPGSVQNAKVEDKTEDRTEDRAGDQTGDGE